MLYTLVLTWMNQSINEMKVSATHLTQIHAQSIQKQRKFCSVAAAPEPKRSYDRDGWTSICSSFVNNKHFHTSGAKWNFIHRSSRTNSSSDQSVDGGKQFSSCSDERCSIMVGAVTALLVFSCAVFISSLSSYSCVCCLPDCLNTLT